MDVLTPPSVYREAHPGAIQGDRKRENAYAWQAHAGQVEALVGVRVVPSIVALDDQRARFVTDVKSVRLLRNGVEVVPVVPGRFCGRAIAPAGPRHFEGCLAFYQYTPEAFAPGADLELEIDSDDVRSRPRRWKLPSSLVEMVWSDFAPWLAALPRGR